MCVAGAASDLVLAQQHSVQWLSTALCWQSTHYCHSLDALVEMSPFSDVAAAGTWSAATREGATVCFSIS